MPRDSLSLTLDLISFVSRVLLPLLLPSLLPLLLPLLLFVWFHTNGRLECSSWVLLAFACNRNTSTSLLPFCVWKCVCLLHSITLLFPPSSNSVSLPWFLLLLSLLLVSVEESCYGIEQKIVGSLSLFLSFCGCKTRDNKTRKTRCVSLVLFSHPISCLTLVLLLFFFFTVLFSELWS